MRNITVAIAIAALAVGSANADTISVNFAENTNQGLAGGSDIGPLATDSANWNSSIGRDLGTLGSGTHSNLIDNTNTDTGAIITWNSGGTYYNSDGTGDDQHKLAVGYLDDTATSGSTGVVITVTDIPYAEYRVYGLVSSDFATSAQNALVNGSWVSGDGTAPIGEIYGAIEANNTANGSFWTEIVSGSVTGNYWTVETSGSTLQIDVLARNSGSRGSISGIVIEQIPEPATLGMVGLFGGAILLIRRRLMI